MAPVDQLSIMRCQCGTNSEYCRQEGVRCPIRAPAGVVRGRIARRRMSAHCCLLRWDCPSWNRLQCRHRRRRRRVLMDHGARLQALLAEGTCDLAISAATKHAQKQPNMMQASRRNYYTVYKQNKHITHYKICYKQPHPCSRGLLSNEIRPITLNFTTNCVCLNIFFTATLSTRTRLAPKPEQNPLNHV